MNEKDQVALGALIADLKYNLTLSPWARSNTPETWRTEARDEAQELVNAKTPEDAKSESGDVLMDVLSSILASEARGDFTLEDVVASARAKLRRRKPWLFTGELPPATPEDERVIWEEQKRRERQLPEAATRQE